MAAKTATATSRPGYSTKSPLSAAHAQVSKLIETARGDAYAESARASSLRDQANAAEKRAEEFTALADALEEFLKAQR